jgi:hypothetical protein
MPKYRIKAGYRDAGKILEYTEREAASWPNRLELVAGTEKTSKELNLDGMTVDEILSAVAAQEVTTQKAAAFLLKRPAIAPDAKTIADMAREGKPGDLIIDDMTIDEVLSAIVTQQITAEGALAKEKAGKGRKTLITKLEELINEPNGK